MARSLALCLAGAAALQAPAPRPARTALGSTEIGVGPETGGVMWDPAGFGKLASPTTMKWFRASELKHGRVAMLATLGWAVQSNGGGVIPFPLESGLAPLSTKPLEANAQLWGMASGMGFLQIILTCGVIELVTESTGTHYMSAGGNGYIDISELKNELQAMGQEPGSIQDVVSRYDENGDGYINFNEFSELIRKLSSENQSKSHSPSGIDRMDTT